MNEELALRAVLALESMAAPSWVDIGGLGIGLLQCGLIHIGLRRMGEATAERKAQHEETMAALQNQHTESMTALRTLIERTAPRP